MSTAIFVWIDLEMTGLNPETDAILEIATIITDGNLTILEQGPEFVIHQPDTVLDSMVPVVRDLHAKSGLKQAVKKSDVSMEYAEEQTLAFIKKHVRKRKGYLAGNSVWQDRAFLRQDMPSITDYLHYRLLDVTSIKIAINSWYPEQRDMGDKKQDRHRALDDIKESIEELAFYRKHFFK